MLETLLFLAWFVPAFMLWLVLASFTAGRFVDWDMERRAKRRKRQNRGC